MKISRNLLPQQEQLAEAPLSNYLCLKMEIPSSELFSQLEIDTIISGVDPQAVDQLIESLSKDLENNNCEINNEHYNPVSGTLVFGNTSPVNFSHGDPSPSHKVVDWRDQVVENIDLKVLEKSNAKSNSIRLPHYAQEHVVAERKRRQNISQQFQTLSTLVPELKKTDKVSLLEGTIGYLKTLEQKVENLEEEAKWKGQKNQSSSILFTNDNDQNNTQGFEANLDSLPKVEANLQGKSVQIRIQCIKRKGALVKVFSEIDKLCLSVINTNAVQFGSSLNMTITAEKEEGFNSTLADIIRNLNSVIREFHG